MIIFVLAFAYGKYCEDDLTEIITNDLYLRVDSYLSRGQGLDWIGSLHSCQNRTDSIYATIHWKQYSATKVTFGFCVPETCDKETAERVLSGLVRSSELRRISSDEISFILFDFKVSPEMPLSGKFFLYSFYILLALTSISTVLFPFMPRENMLSSFSLIRNLVKLFTVSNNFGKLQFLDGIRTICSILLIGFHCFFIQIYIPMSNRAEFNSIFHSFSFTLICTLAYTVDIFFFISGFLMSFLTVQDLRKQGKNFKWVSFFIRRLIRYLPMYLFVIGVERVSSGSKPGSIGNVIGYATTLEVSKDWWGSLLFIHHMLSTKDVNYMSWTWSVAADFQFYLVCSICLFIYSRNRTWGYLSALFILSGSVLYTGLVSYFYQFSPSPILGILDLTQLNTIYVRPVPRIGVFVVGLISGLVYLESQVKDKGKVAYQVKDDFAEKFEKKCVAWLADSWTKNACCVAGTFASIGVALSPYYLEVYGEQAVGNFGKSIWLALQRPLFVLGFALWVLALGSGHFSSLSSFLSLWVFRFWSKISYTVYLIHCLIFSAVFMSVDDYIVGGWETLVEEFRPLIGLTFGFAIVLEILVQMPFIGLEKLLIGRQ